MKDDRHWPICRQATINQSFWESVHCKSAAGSRRVFRLPRPVSSQVQHHLSGSRGRGATVTPRRLPFLARQYTGGLKLSQLNSRRPPAPTRKTQYIIYFNCVAGKNTSFTCTQWRSQRRTWGHPPTRNLPPEINPWKFATDLRQQRTQPAVSL